MPDKLDKHNAVNATVLLALSVSLLLLSIAALPVGKADSGYYPFKTQFEKDLAAIASHTPHVESIDVIHVLLLVRTVVIRISYTPHLSDSKRITAQNEVQQRLEQKSYIESVERNFLVCIPEDKSCPPWPGFVIGELLVEFVDIPKDPILHPWPANSTLEASNIGSTNLTLTWTSTQVGSHTVEYRIDLPNGTLVTVSNSTLTYLVAGLKPGTSYEFRVDALNDQGVLNPGPSTFATTQTETPSGGHIPPTPSGNLTSPNRNTVPTILAVIAAASTTVFVVVMFLKNGRRPRS